MDYGRTFNEQMREESRYLRSHARARAALKEVVEMPDPQADRVLRSLEQNRGELSNALAKEMPILLQPGVWAEIAAAVSQVYQEGDVAYGAVTPCEPSGVRIHGKLHGFSERF